MVVFAWHTVPIAVFKQSDLLTFFRNCPSCTLRGHRKKILNYDAFLSLNVVLILVNSADPDEMQH